MVSRSYLQHTTRSLAVLHPRTIHGLNARNNQAYNTRTLNRTISTGPPNHSPLDTAVSRRRRRVTKKKKITKKKASILEDSDVLAADEHSSLDNPKEQTEHAVISAFDLFSIGGELVLVYEYTYGTQAGIYLVDSWPKLLSHCRSDASGQDFHQRPERVGPT